MPSNKNDGKINLHLRISPELDRRLATVADERVVSVNFLAIKAIEYYLERLASVSEIMIVREKYE